MQDELQPLEELDALKKKADDSCENCPEDTRPVDKRSRSGEGKRSLMVDPDKAPDAWETPKRFWLYLLIRMTQNFFAVRLLPAGCRQDTMYPIA